MKRISDNAPSDPIEKLAWYLDQAFRIPGTRWRFGWDAIIGLIPGLGEVVMLFLQAAIVLAAVSRYEVPAIIAVRMILNVGIDGVIGSIPFFGDIFDFVFKANTRNIHLLNQVRQARSAGRPVSKARHWGFVIGVFTALLAIVGGILALLYYVFLWVIRALSVENTFLIVQS